jgi:hypothetical protein|nr:MAG TPA: minor tail protein [Caudoviricetes sp.]
MTAEILASYGKRRREIEQEALEQERLKMQMATERQMQQQRMADAAQAYGQTSVLAGNAAGANAAARERARLLGTIAGQPWVGPAEDKDLDRVGRSLGMQNAVEYRNRDDGSTTALTRGPTGGITSQQVIEPTPLTTVMQDEEGNVSVTQGGATPSAAPARVRRRPLPAQIEALIERKAAQYGVDPALVRAVVVQESGGNPNARSPVGAQGLMQLMPATAAGLGVRNPADPEQNLDGGVRYLAQQLKAFGGDVSKALAAYNAGPGAVQRHGGVPPYRETQGYVNSIMSMYQPAPRGRVVSIQRGGRPVYEAPQPHNQVVTTPEGIRVVDTSRPGLIPGTAGDGAGAQGTGVRGAINDAKLLEEAVNLDGDFRDALAFVTAARDELKENRDAYNGYASGLAPDSAVLAQFKAAMDKSAASMAVAMRRMSAARIVAEQRALQRYPELRRTAPQQQAPAAPSGAAPRQDGAAREPVATGPVGTRARSAGVSEEDRQLFLGGI